MIMKAVSVKNSSPSQVDQRRKGLADDDRTDPACQGTSHRQTGTRVISDRIIESEIANWCERVLDPDLENRVEEALAKASHPLKSVRCACDDQTLTLSGVVTCYHHAQVAIEVARRLADGRKVDCQIQITKPANS